jgi:hypothetical protein
MSDVFSFPSALAVYQEADHESFQRDGLKQGFGAAKRRFEEAL